MPVQKSQIRTAPRPRCFLCDREGELLHQNLTDPFFSAPGVWTFKRCPNCECGLIWLDLAPLSEDLHLAYQKYFTHGDEDGRPDLARRVRSFLYACYQIGATLPAAIIGLQSAKSRANSMFLNDR